jgi:hypothetical protein
MAEEDKKFCIELLGNIEIKHGTLIMTMRNETRDEIHEHVTGPR